MPKTDAERSREYRLRKKENDAINKIKKPPKSSTERVRDFRARQMKILDKQNENNSYNVNNNVAGEPNSDKGRLFLHVKHDNGSDYDDNTGMVLFDKFVWFSF
ncbi:uncharacterized protein LOC123667009 [Melitaea cinxia]|uniref:uncharacterized protein LOC123667009 n=1 Tax=Melitaea cinxia TaxID=113334 RepID=UPI001E274381|nr:uncharacterized protein LOC123667009 [Melitaea cinxia]